MARGKYGRLVPIGLLALGLLQPGCSRRTKSEGSAPPAADASATSNHDRAASKATAAAKAKPSPGASLIRPEPDPDQPVRNAAPRATGHPPDLARLNLPPGFHIEVFAEDVSHARSLAVSKRGIVYVGTRGDPDNRVFALVPDESKMRVAKKVTLVSGLDTPNGVALHEGDLYIAEIDRISVLRNVDEHLDDPQKPEPVGPKYPSDPSHGWKYIAVGPDGYLYVPVGAPCNVCKRGEPIYASITRMKLDGSAREVFTNGVRNTVGFDWHPKTKELWFTDNGRDLLGDDLPPDEVNLAPKAGLHFGFPYCHGGNIVDPEFGTERPCSEFVPPVKNLGAHVAALGLHFYRGRDFPESYRNQAFVAEHGSWNRRKKNGYQVGLLRTDGKTVTSYESFLTGFLTPDGDVLGRPVAFAELPDGSLLVSDDFASAIYRISYEGK